MEKFPLHLDGELRNLTNRKSVPPSQKQPFADIPQSRCS